MWPSGWWPCAGSSLRSDPGLNPSGGPCFYKVLTPIPGIDIDIETSTRFLTESTGKHFGSVAHLVSSAGIARKHAARIPRSEVIIRMGNKKLKRAVLFSDLAVPKYPPSRTHGSRGGTEENVKPQRHTKWTRGLCRCCLAA